MAFEIKDLEELINSIPLEDMQGENLDGLVTRFILTMAHEGYLNALRKYIETKPSSGKPKKLTKPLEPKFDEFLQPRLIDFLKIITDHVYITWGETQEEADEQAKKSSYRDTVLPGLLTRIVMILSKAQKFDNLVTVTVPDPTEGTVYSYMFGSQDKIDIERIAVYIERCVTGSRTSSELLNELAFKTSTTELKKLPLDHTKFDIASDEFQQLIADTIAIMKSPLEEKKTRVVSPSQVILRLFMQLPQANKTVEDKTKSDLIITNFIRILSHAPKELHASIHSSFESYFKREDLKIEISETVRSEIRAGIYGLIGKSAFSASKFFSRNKRAIKKIFNSSSDENAFREAFIRQFGKRIEGKFNKQGKPSTLTAAHLYENALSDIINIAQQKFLTNSTANPSAFFSRPAAVPRPVGHDVSNTTVPAYSI